MRYLHPVDRERARRFRAERIARLEYDAGLRAEKPGCPSILSELDGILIAAYDAELAGERIPWRIRRRLARRARMHERHAHAWPSRVPATAPRALPPRA